VGTDESIQHAGRTITARDLPRGELGVYRHYEVDGVETRFDSLDAAKEFCDAVKSPPPPPPPPDPPQEPENGGSPATPEKQE
jgi:hypothetical protein